MLAEKILPSEFDLQRKQGFSIPMTNWLKSGPFRELFWDTLSNANGIFEQQMLNGLMISQDKGFSNGERLFALVLFQLWKNEYKISI